MNKIIALILVVLMTAMMISGCATAEQTDNSKVLRVGMDLKFPPYSYVGENGEAAGLEPVIAEAFAEFLGMDVEIVNTDFSLLLAALETGDVDILIADMSITDERLEKADFSDPYRYTQSLALVNKDFAVANNVTDDMEPEVFFNLEGSKFIGLAGTFGVVVPQSFGVDVTEVTEIGNGILEVTNGQSTGLVASSEIHSFHAANKDTTIVYSGIGDVSKSCFVVQKGNADLIEKSNEFIKTMYESGGLYDQIRPEFDKIVADFLQNDELGLDYVVNSPE